MLNSNKLNGLRNNNCILLQFTWSLATVQSIIRDPVNKSYSHIRYGREERLSLILNEEHLLTLADGQYQTMSIFCDDIPGI